jgi:uncharacterized membrane protein YhfC
MISAHWPWWLIIISLLITGITEESIKILPLASRSLRRSVANRSAAFVMAAALGVGFGLGEAWYIAWQIFFRNPEIAKMPFYLLSGFMGERVFTMLLHSVFLVFPLFGLASKSGGIFKGLLIGIVVHAIMDLPAALYQSRILSNGIVAVLYASIALLVALGINYISRDLNAVAQVGPSKKNIRILYESEQRNEDVLPK